MADWGLFHGQRAELLEGEIVVLGPQKFLHTATVDRTGEVLRAALGAGFWVRTQLPVDLGVFS
jgi:hypothetical protein